MLTDCYVKSLQKINPGNNNDFLCANILEDQAQWRDKTKGLSNCVNVEQCVSRWWMDEGWKKSEMFP